MGPFVVSALKFGAIEPRRRLDHDLARRLSAGLHLGKTHTVRDVLPVLKPFFCVIEQGEL